MGFTRPYTITVLNVDNAGTETTINVPWNGWIRRARVTNAAAANVTLEIRRFSVAAADAFDPILAYSSTANPLDALECIHYQKDPATETDYYVQLSVVVSAVGVVAPGTTVDVQLSIEGPGDPNGMGQGII